MYLLAHLSDPHLGPIPRARVSELLGKRLIGMTNWIGARRRNFGVATLGPLVADLIAQRPDHICVTGDLANISLPGEFDTGAAFLASLGPAERVSVVPGNHDAYVHSAIQCHLQRWAPFLSGDAGSGSEAPFPYVRRRGPLALVGVSSAIPTAAFMARGRVGRAQLARLRPLLAALKAEGLFRVVMIHHPPTGHRPFHRDLDDAAAFRAVLAAAGAELVIHGHDHRASLSCAAGEAGTVPVVGVPSASAGPEDHRGAGGYCLYRISGAPGAWRCEMERRGYAHGEVKVHRLSLEHLDIGGAGTPALAAAGAA